MSRISTRARDAFLGAFFLLVASSGAVWATVTAAAGETVFDTNKTITSGTGNLVLKTSDVPGANVGGSISFQGEWFSVTPLYTDFAFIQGGKETAGDGTSDAGNLRFGTRPLSGTMTERVRIASDGKVGVNDTSAAEMLSVGGAIFTSNATPGFTKRGMYFNFIDTSSTGFITTYRPAIGYEHLQLDSTDFSFHTHNSSDVQTLAITSSGVVAGTGANPVYTLDYGRIMATSPSADATASTLTMGCGTGTTNAFNGICNLQANNDQGSGVSAYRAMRIDGTNVSIRTDSSTLTGKTHFNVDASGNVAVGTEAQTSRFQVNGAMAAGTGTISSSGTAVTGSGTSFGTQVKIGDTIMVTSSGSFGIDYREVTAIADATHLTLSAAFAANVSAGTSFQYNTQLLAMRDAGDLQVPNYQTAKPACAADTDVGKFLMYSKSAGATISMCFCQKVASSYLWAAVGTGDCT